MFDWNDEQVVDQVGDTIWAELNESEDHLVPYPKGTENTSLLTFGDQKKNDEAANMFGLTGWASGAQTVVPSNIMEKQHARESNGGLSAPRLDMESWPDLPSLNAGLGRDFNNDTCEDAMASAYLDDFNDTSSADKVGGSATVQPDSDTQVFGNEHEENNSFLECDWGYIGDFDDFDCLFSNNESLFGGEIVGDGGDFLPTPSDVITSSVESIPFPLLPLHREQSYSHASSLQFNENLVRSNEPEEKSEGQKRLGRSRKKAEKRNRSKVSSNFSDFSHRVGKHTALTLHTLVKPPLQSSLSPGARQIHFCNGENIGRVGHTNQLIVSGYGCPAYPFPPIVPNTRIDSNEAKTVDSSYFIPTDPSSKCSAEKTSDVLSKPLVMTRQEKIEKLRRRQQMQAMLAIQQQQQQFVHRVSVNDTLVPLAHSPRNQHSDSLASTFVVEEAKLMSSELNVPAVQEEFQKSSVTCDNPIVEEKIYYELQDVLGKLDNRIRLCIKDSLFRLARNATERQDASDSSSTNKSNKYEDEDPEKDATNTRKRSATTMETETYTNPIDRTVAYFLFQRPTEKSVAPATEEISSSPMSFEPDSKVPLNTPVSLSSEDRTKVQGNEVQPSV